MQRVALHAICCKCNCRSNSNTISLVTTKVFRLIFTCFACSNNKINLRHVFPSWNDNDDDDSNYNIALTTTNCKRISSTAAFPCHVIHTATHKTNLRSNTWTLTLRHMLFTAAAVCVRAMACVVHACQYDCWQVYVRVLLLFRKQLQQQQQKTTKKKRCHQEHLNFKLRVFFLSVFLCSWVCVCF